MVPLARPESTFDETELDESAPSSRLSSTWKDFHLPIVEQSIDSLNSSRSRSEAPLSPIAVKSLSSTPTIHKHLNDQFFSIPSIPASQSAFTAPPKPPRTFETERSREWNSSDYNTSISSYNSVQSPCSMAPAKPPRTYEYIMVDSASYSYDLNSFSPTLSPYKESFSYPNGFTHTEGSSSFKCQDFVDNANPLAVNATGTSHKSYSTTVTYLQDRSCLTLCNGFKGIQSSRNQSTKQLENSTKSSTLNNPTRVLSDDKMNVNNFSENQLQIEQKSYSLANTADINCRMKNGLSSSTEQNVVIRHGKGNRNRSKRRAIYWDGDETTSLLQYSCSCSDIPDISVLDPSTHELENGMLETLL